MTETPSRVLDFWEAFDRIEPIGGQWMQSAMIAQQLSVGHSIAMAAFGGKHDPKPLEDFMPGSYVRAKKRKSAKSGIGLSAMRSKLEKKVK